MRHTEWKLYADGKCAYLIAEDGRAHRLGRIWVEDFDVTRKQRRLRDADDMGGKISSNPPYSFELTVQIGTKLNLELFAEEEDQLMLEGGDKVAEVTRRILESIEGAL